MKNIIFFLCIVFTATVEAQYTEIAMNNNGGFWLLGADKKVTSVNADLSGWAEYPGGGLGFHLRSNRGTPLLVGMNEHFFNTNGQGWYELSGGGSGKLILSDQVTGQYWCIGSDQSIFSLNGQSWTQYPRSSGILAHAKDMAVHNNVLYVIGISDTKIYRTLSSGRWEWMANGLGKRITVDAKTGTPWCIGTGDDIFKFDGQKWVAYGDGSGRGKELAVYNNVPYLIANDGSIWKGTGSSWTKVPIRRVIPSSTWQTALNGVFKSSCVRLNNYTPIQNQYDRNERQFYKPDDSYIQLNLNGNVVKYPIPIDVMQVGPNQMFKMYINDWNTNRITAEPDNGKIKITLRFEDDGVEIVGNCYNNLACGFTSPPKFNYSNSRIDIYLDLYASRGQISYNASDVFTANVTETGPCVDNLFAFLCPSDRAGLIKSNVEAKINEHLNSQSIKPLLSMVFSRLLPNEATVNHVVINNQGDIQVW